MAIATVTRLLITPVKSTMAQEVDRLELQAGGVAGDRRFLFGRLDGSRPSGISKAPLIKIRSEWDLERERLTLSLPDGSVVEGDARPRGAPIEVRLFDRSVMANPIDPVFRAVVDPIDPTLTILRVVEPEYAGGMHRVSLVSTASVVAIGSAGGDPSLDARRFRMLVEVDGVEPFTEDAWSGHRLRIGGSVVRVGETMPRCVMTTLDPRTGEQDFPTLDVLTRERLSGGKPRLGVYGAVEVPGAIATGDPVDLIRA